MITGNFYIGQSKNVIKRYYNHRCKKHFSSILLHEDIERYGIENFKLEVIEECDIEELQIKELEYIHKLQPYYNVIGKPRSEETRKKLSIANIGKKQSEETKEKRKRSIAERHKTIPQLNLNHRKKVVVDEILIFESVKDCANYLGVTPSSLSHDLKKNRKCANRNVKYLSVETNRDECNDVG